ncbi:hypothetical protein BZA70DRAFT_201117 [Myxozyma melibiosi]|uniref:Secreted protein n=1 Tax=Myxozyma melibiosi TaxID=54550 RepID=A0ABR1F2T2_9ASCO
MLSWPRCAVLLCSHSRTFGGIFIQQEHILQNQSAFTIAIFKSFGIRSKHPNRAVCKQSQARRAAEPYPITCRLREKCSNRSRPDKDARVGWITISWRGCVGKGKTATVNSTPLVIPR